MKREQLIDRMIRIYGFEHEAVIDFAKLCEHYPVGEVYDDMLEILVECHEEDPVDRDEEEE